MRRVIAKPANARPTRANAPGSGTLVITDGGDAIVYEAEIASFPRLPAALDWVAEKVKLMAPTVKVDRVPSGVKLPSAVTPTVRFKPVGLSNVRVWTVPKKFPNALVKFTADPTVAPIGLVVRELPGAIPDRSPVPLLKTEEAKENTVPSAMKPVGAPVTPNKLMEPVPLMGAA